MDDRMRVRPFLVNSCIKCARSGAVCGIDLGRLPSHTHSDECVVKSLTPVQLLGGYLFNFRCRVRRCMLSARAAAEIFPSTLVSTRWMCSHSRRSTDNGLIASGTSTLALLRSKAATTWSALVGLVR